MKLNLGAGDFPLDGYLNLDRKTGQEIYPLSKFSDESIDECRCSHVLEHFSHRLTLSVLAEWVRVLRPGGILKIAVPNFDYASTHRDHPHWKLWIFGGHMDESDHHGALFTVSSLVAQLQYVGLTAIDSWTSEIKDCASLPVSLNLMGVKP